MTRTVHWLGGWASSLSCWELMLRHSFPGFEHRFLDSHDWLDASPGEAGLTELPKGDVAAAWSLGTLLAHRWIAQDAWPRELPLLSLCPIFQFLRPGGYGEPILLRMQEKLAADREAVLRDFWRRMRKASSIPAIWENAWVEGGLRYNTNALIRGLDFLREVQVDPNALPGVPRRWELLIGEQDPLAPAGEWIASLPEPAAAATYAGGHLPFCECPGAVLSSLRRLAA